MQYITELISYKVSTEMTGRLTNCKSALESLYSLATRSLSNPGRVKSL